MIVDNSNKIEILIVDNSFYGHKTKIILQNNYVRKVNGYLKDIDLNIIFKNILWGKKINFLTTFYIFYKNNIKIYFR